MVVWLAGFGSSRRLLIRERPAGSVGLRHRRSRPSGCAIEINVAHAVPEVEGSPFERFLRRSHAGATELVSAVTRLLIGPFFAPSFAAFWRGWNPLYRYALWHHVYAPLRRRVPRAWAACFTFPVCGAELHDMPWFCLSAIFWDAGPGFPGGTVLFGVWGFLAEVSRRWGRPRSGGSPGSCHPEELCSDCAAVSWSPWVCVAWWMGDARRGRRNRPV